MDLHLPQVFVQISRACFTHRAGGVEKRLRWSNRQVGFCFQRGKEHDNMKVALGTDLLFDISTFNLRLRRVEAFVHRRMGLDVRFLECDSCCFFWQVLDAEIQEGMDLRHHGGDQMRFLFLAQSGCHEGQDERTAEHFTSAKKHWTFLRRGFKHRKELPKQSRIGQKFRPNTLLLHPYVPNLPLSWAVRNLVICGNSAVYDRRSFVGSSGLWISPQLGWETGWHSRVVGSMKNGSHHFVWCPKSMDSWSCSSQRGAFLSLRCGGST